MILDRNGLELRVGFLVMDVVSGLVAVITEMIFIHSIEEYRVVVLGLESSSPYDRYLIGDKRTLLYVKLNSSLEDIEVLYVA